VLFMQHRRTKKKGMETTNTAEGHKLSVTFDLLPPRAW